MSKPIYYKIYDEIKKDIANKKYKAGEILPSERDFMKIFSVSRTTVRQALQKLQLDNLIYKVQGKGNIVSSKLISQPLNSFYSFYNTMISLGKSPTSKLISCEIIDAGKKFSEVFSVSEISKVYHIKRLRLIDGEPAMLENTFIPEYRFKNFNHDKLNKIPMYKIFKEEYDVKFTNATETFKPILVKEKEDIKYLEINKKDIVMQITRTAYEMNKVIEYTVSHVKNDLFEYTVNLPIL